MSGLEMMLLGRGRDLLLRQRARRHRIMIIRHIGVALAVARRGVELWRCRHILLLPLPVPLQHLLVALRRVQIPLVLEIRNNVLGLLLDILLQQTRYP